LLDTSKPFEQRLTQTLANQWAVGSVTDWTSIRTGEFKAKWELAKQAIENVGPVVPEPGAEPEEHVTAIGPKVWEMEDDAKVRVLMPDGAKAVSYWYGNEGALSADGKVTAQDDPVIALDPAKKGAGFLRLIAYDNDGNASKPVVYQFGHKKKKHEVVVEGKELFGGDKATFRVPDSLDSFVEVVKSLTDLALQRKAITEDAAQHILAALGQLKK
jgi:hypothetical protein